ncbi:MAG: PilN domain-containing protein [Myxococcales bacterium]|nr:PilN domain-containing protein [Myxococcales bacterium]
MIRVNLLPQVREKRAAAPQKSQTWLLVIMLLVVVSIVGLFFFHQTRTDKLAVQQGENARLQSQINDIQALIKDHAEVKDALAKLRAREDAMARLISARRGPTGVLVELAHVLTRGRGPSVDPEELAERKRRNEQDVFNPSWDTRRVWLTLYDETERKVRLEGQARDANDVYEFAQRLRLSPYFGDVQLMPGQQETDQQTKVEVVKFALTVKVRY